MTPVTGPSSRELRGCRKKKRYGTKELAERVAAGQLARHGVTRLHAYQCSFCGCWHIGHDRRR